jgi:ribonuclease-3
MSRFPEVDEGTLSKARSALVSTGALADLAMELELGGALLLGKGEERTGGRSKPSILADALEAIVAAIYLDGGFEAAFGFISRLLEPRLGPALQELRDRDPKTHLQERIQALTKRPPSYRLTGTTGPEHELRFVVCLQSGDRVLAKGEGRTKKEAEQDAAARVLERLRKGESLEALLGLPEPLPEA